MMAPKDSHGLFPARYLRFASKDPHDLIFLCRSCCWLVSPLWGFSVPVLPSRWEIHVLMIGLKLVQGKGTC